MRRPPRLAAALSAVSTLLITGCATLEPRYERPAAPVPTSWPQGPAYAPNAAAPTPVSELGWRDAFTDPKLRALIEEALRNNRDLRVAVLNVEQARAQHKVQQAALAPTLTANANYTDENAVAAAGAPVQGGGSDLQFYSLTANVSSYEVDLFGRVRSLSHAALEHYLATDEARRAVQITLIASVADAYLLLAADRERMEVAKNTLAAQQGQFDLIRARFDHQIASELDLRQAETGVDQARSDVAALTTQAAQDLNALNLVVGAAVGEDRLATTLEGAAPMAADLPAGLSSAVLLQRPDVSQAEHELKANNADIGAARAAFFPTLTLTAAGGGESPQLSGLLAAGAGLWSFTPNLAMPIFDWGANRARLSSAKAARGVAQAQYEKAIQTAFREVADALARRGTITAQLTADRANVNAASEALRLSRARYERGVDPYLNTLLAQGALYAAQQRLISTELARFENLADLYRALGGGAKDHSSG